MSDEEEKADKDEVVKLRAGMDQGAMALREFAPTLWEFHKSLVDQGFTRAEATTIVTAWFVSSCGGGST